MFWKFLNGVVSVMLMLTLSIVALMCVFGVLLAFTHGWQFILLLPLAGCIFLIAKIFAYLFDELELRRSAVDKV